MSNLFFHMADDDDDDDGMYYRVAYLINKVLKVLFETTVPWCIFCCRVYIFLSVSSLIFKLFPLIKLQVLFV